jgi:PAS domain S-box-containing protein
MAVSKNFYAFLSDLFQQMAQDPHESPPIPLHHWPEDSMERRLLEDLQTALAARPRLEQNHPAQGAEKQLRSADIFEAAPDGLIIQDIDTGLVADINQTACRMYAGTKDAFLGQSFLRFVQPESFPEYEKYLHTVQSEGFSIAQQIHLRQNGSPFYVEISGAHLTGQGHTFILSSVRDVSQRVIAEHLLHKQVEMRTREQFILHDISQTLASALELQPGLVLDQLRMIIDYTHGGLFKLQDSTLVVLAARGSQPLEQALPFQINLQSPETSAFLLNKRRTTRIADVQSTDPAARFLRTLLAGQASILLEGVRSWMWVPLAIKDQIIGAIGVAHVERNFFTAHHANLALTVANQAAITMVNAELYEHAQALAALQERQRLARSLHDAVNQSLFSAGLIAEVLPRLWEQDPDEGRRSLEDLRRLTRGAQADMRLLLAELRPSTLTDAELGDLLRLLGSALAGRTNIPIEVTVKGEGKLPTEVQVTLYRLCQEGLSNIAKHAGASRVDILLQYDPGRVELHIRDDGRGFNPQQDLPGHYGLSMMHERAAAIGASLSINSQPGQGAEIVIRWAENQNQKGEKS